MKISIVIRSKNDGKVFERTLKSIQHQSLITGGKKLEVEVVSVDNESTDNSMDLLDRIFPHAKKLSIKSGTYIPGKVLNRAVLLCRGDIIVFNNSDCIPQNKDWLIHLVSPIIKGKTSITYARQTHRPDAWPLVKKDSLQTYPSTHKTNKWHVFSLASCAISKALISKYPFNEVIQYSEDIEWSINMIKKNQSIFYTYDAIVEHSHNYNPQELKKRFYNEGKAEAIIFKDLYHKKYSFLYFYPSLVNKILKDTFFLIKTFNLSYFLSGMRYRINQQLSLKNGYKDNI